MAEAVRTGARAPAMDRFSLSRLLRARETGVFLALLVLCLFLSFATDGFLTSLNLLNVGRQISLLGIMAVGMTFVLISGEVDLSVGSTYALAGLATGMLIIAGWPLAAGAARWRLLIGIADRPDQRRSVDLWPAAVADRDARHAVDRARRGADPHQRPAGDRQRAQRRRLPDVLAGLHRSWARAICSASCRCSSSSSSSSRRSPGSCCPTPISASGSLPSAAAPRRRASPASRSTPSRSGPSC